MNCTFQHFYAYFDPITKLSFPYSMLFASTNCEWRLDICSQLFYISQQLFLVHYLSALVKKAVDSVKFHGAIVK